MKEIKFRGKLKEHFGDKNGNVVLQKGTWIYGGIVFDENRVWIDTKYHGEIIVDKDTIGQYTGLKDENGIEIYEGDIVRTHYIGGDGVENDEVIFDRGCFCVNYSEDYHPLLNEVNHCSEVIGNIYDNSELLEEK